MGTLNRRRVITSALAAGGILLSNHPAIAQRGPSGQTTVTPVTQTGNGPIDLGTTGGDLSEAVAISRSGAYIAGWSYNANEDPRGFLWDGTTMIELGSLGGQESEGNGVNSSGLVVGSAVSSDENRYAVQFDGPTAVSLGTIGGSRSRASGVNDDGLIVGHSSDEQDNDQAVMVVDGQMTALSAFPSTQPQARAFAVNAAGVIVGLSINASGKARAVRWSIGGGIQDIAPMMQDEGVAVALNDAGQIVGQVMSASGTAQAVLWQPDGAMVTLPSEPDYASEATGISESGIVCGNLLDGNGHRVAVRWVDGVLERLPTLGGPRSIAYAISADGTIVGSSRTGPDDDEASASHATVWPAT